MPNKKSEPNNTLTTPQSTRPFADRLPPKNPFFGPSNNFKKPAGPKFNTAFRTQNKGGGGK